MSKNVRVAALLAFAGAGVVIAAGEAQAQGGPYQFNALTPCRVFDTRTTGDETSSTPLTKVEAYFTVRGKCGVPTTARAVTINLTIVAPTAAGHITIFPSDVARPLVSTLNFNANEPALANGAIVPLAATTGATTRDIALYPGLAGTGTVVHVLMDITGYFAE